MKDTSRQLENTDELPVLSEEAIAQFPSREADAVLARIEALEQAVREAIASHERHWQRLDDALEAQRQAIETLQRALADLGPGSRRGDWRRAIRRAPEGKARR